MIMIDKVILISFPQAGSDVLACLSIDGAPQVTHSYNTVDHLRESPLDLVSNNALILRFASTYFLIGVPGNGNLPLCAILSYQVYLLYYKQILYFTFGIYRNHQEDNQYFPRSCLIQSLPFKLFVVLSLDALF